MVQEQSSPNGAIMPSAPETKLWNRNFMAVCGANFMLFFSFYLLLPLLPLYLRDSFSASRDTIGLILSGYTITALLIRPFSGFFVDSYPRKAVLLVSYGAFVAIFGGYIAALSISVFALARALHGAAFGSVTVANSTVAIDMMPPARRGEGIGYYGVANSVAMAMGPSVSMWLYDSGMDARIIFAIAMGVSAIGLLLNTTIRPRHIDCTKVHQPISMDRFFLIRALPESGMIMFFSFAYAILTTYVAIYGREEIGITTGTGTFFTLLATGLISSRVTASRWIRRGKLMLNISTGMAATVLGYLCFVTWRDTSGFYISAFILGAGYGFMAPSFQTLFIDLAPNNRRGTANSTYLTSWDVGVGAGLMIGGGIAEHYSYYHAYIMALAMCVIGTLIFRIFVARHFNRNKLR